MADSQAEDTVTFQVEDRIAWVKYNRPEKRNAQSPELNRRMGHILNELEFDENVGVLVLTGEGDAFCAGMDLDEYFRASEAVGLKEIRRTQREAYGWWQRLRWYQKPTIAMVNGWCFGGAYGPLFACDIAIAADQARFGLSEINWGILPGGGATKVAQALMPFRKAMYHAMTGENIDGKTAETWGLVTESVPSEQLEKRVIEVANVLLRKNPWALKAAKDAMRRVVDMTYDNAEDYLVRAQESASFFDDEGRREGLKQFLDDKSFKPGLSSYDVSKHR